MKTALNGKFVKGIMKAAVPTKITSERCNNGVKEIQTSSKIRKMHMPTIFKFERPTKYSLGDQPTSEDPYESQHVKIHNIEQWQQGEKGLFAQVDIDKGQLISYYSGTIWNTTETSVLPVDFSVSHL